MKPLRIVVAVVGVLIAVAGIAGILAPSMLFGFGASLLTPAGLYIIAAVRVVFGAVLLFVAASSRMPKTVRTIGIVVIVAGLLTPLFGVERSEALLSWWSSQDPTIVRAFFALPVILGGFLVHVVNGSRRIAAQH